MEYIGYNIFDYSISLHVFWKFYIYYGNTECKDENDHAISDNDSNDDDDTFASEGISDLHRRPTAKRLPTRK